MVDMQIVPASKNVEAQYVEMMVPLYSYGCEKKIKKTLSHLKGRSCPIFPSTPTVLIERTLKNYES